MSSGLVHKNLKRARAPVKKSKSTIPSYKKNDFKKSENTLFEDIQNIENKFNDSIHEGLISIPQKFGKAKSRKFILFKNQLKWYKSQKGKLKMDDLISLEQIEKIEFYSKKKNIGITITHKGSKIHLLLEKLNDTKEWINLLRKYSTNIQYYTNASIKIDTFVDLKNMSKDHSCALMLTNDYIYVTKTIEEAHSLELFSSPSKDVLEKFENSVLINKIDVNDISIKQCDDYMEIKIMKSKDIKYAFYADKDLLSDWVKCIQKLIDKVGKENSKIKESTEKITSTPPPIPPNLIINKEKKDISLSIKKTEDSIHKIPELKNKEPSMIKLPPIPNFIEPPNEKIKLSKFSSQPPFIGETGEKEISTQKKNISSEFINEEKNKAVKECELIKKMCEEKDIIIKKLNEKIVICMERINELENKLKRQRSKNDDYSKWSHEELSTWINKLSPKFEGVSKIFYDNKIDGKMIKDMDEESVKILSENTLVGILLWKKIAELKNESE